MYMCECVNKRKRERERERARKVLERRKAGEEKGRRPFEPRPFDDDYLRGPYRKLIIKDAITKPEREAV